MPGKLLSMENLRPATLAPLVCFGYFLIRYHSTGYFLGGIPVLIGFYFCYFAWSKTERLGTLALFVIGLGLPALGTWQFLHLQDIGDLDQADYVCALWNMRHGVFDYSFGGKNIFGIHSQYTSVLWIPVHYLAGELGLKLGEGLCLLAAALLIVRRLWGNREVASWAAAAILLSPPVASQFFFGFHPEFLAAPVLVLAFFAYKDGQLGRFLICTAILAYTKEVMTMAIAGLLLVAVVEKRSWKWILLPGMLCCVQMAAYWFLILPHFAPQGNHLGYYMPVSAAQALKMWWRPQNIFYVFHVALPFLPLLWALPKRYLLLPLPMMAFYAAFPDPMFVVLWPNYAFPLSFLCAAGLVLSVDSRRLEGRMLMACAVISLLSYPLWREIFSVPAGDLTRNREVNRMRAVIPPEAKVLVNGPFAARFAARREISIWGESALWGCGKKPFSHFDYIVLDASFSPKWLVDARELRAGVDSLLNDPAWDREYGRDSLFLFRRRDDQGRREPATAIGRGGPPSDI